MRCQPRAQRHCISEFTGSSFEPHLAALHPAHSSSRRRLSDTPCRAVHLHAPHLCIIPLKCLNRALPKQHHIAV